MHPVKRSSTNTFHDRFNTILIGEPGASGWKAPPWRLAAETRYGIPMRTILKQAIARLHTIEDHLTVRLQIAAAFGVICVVLVGLLAAGAALISYRNTATLVESRLAGLAAATSGRLDRFMATRQQELQLFAELQPMQAQWRGDADGLRRSLEALNGY